MSDLDKQMEELITERNAFEAENKALKVVNEQLRAINISVAKKVAEGQSDLVWLTRDDMQEYSDIEQAGGINAIKADTMDEIVQSLLDVYCGSVTTAITRIKYYSNKLRNSNS